MSPTPRPPLARRASRVPHTPEAARLALRTAHAELGRAEATYRAAVDARRTAARDAHDRAGLTWDEVGALIGLDGSTVRKLVTTKKGPRP